MKLVMLIAKLGVFALSFKTLFVYLDPGSGSLLVQLLIAAIVGILATVRLWKTRVQRMFGIGEESEEDDGGESEVQS